MRRLTSLDGSSIGEILVVCAIRLKQAELGTMHKKMEEMLAHIDEVSRAVNERWM